MKKDSPFKVYIVAGNIGWLVITPLLLFIGGGSWLVNRFNWGSWLMIVFVFLGLVVMVGGVWSYLRQLLNMYGDLQKPPPKQDRRDYDYFDDNFK